MTVESDILQLQADVQALTASLEAIRQSLQDQIDLNEAGVNEADTSADTATDNTYVNAQDITELNIALRLYIDSKIAQLRSNYAADFANTLAAVTPQIESDVDAAFTSQITSLNATIIAKTNEAAASAYDANQSYLDASSVFDNLVLTDIPAIQARLSAAEGEVLQHTNSWTSLLSQYGYTSLQQGFDAQVVATNLAISTSASTLKAEIEDINGSSLGATLHNNYYTESGTDGAISTAITTVKSEIEDANGSSLGATVSSQGSAITDLQNNANAGFLIKAQVDDDGQPAAVSLLELIAANDPLSGPTSIAKLQADDILLDGTVSARKLQITDFTDYAQNHKFENDDWDDFWTLDQSYGTVSLSENTGFLNGNALEFSASTSTISYVRAEIAVDVEPNKHYQIEIWARRSSDYAPKTGGTWGSSYLKAYEGTSSTELTFTTYNAGVPATASHVDLDPQQTDQTDFYKISGMITVPDDVNKVTFKFRCPHSAGVLKLSSIKVIAKLAGELIVDGSITANVLDVQDLSAITADMGTITAGVLQSTDQKFTINLTNKTISIET